MFGKCEGVRLMRTAIIAKVHHILFTFIVATTLHVCVYGQTRERVVDWDLRGLPGNHIKGEDTGLVPSEIEALELLGITIEGQSITLGQPFTAGENWLRTLTVRVKNISGKPIKSIRFSFRLPEAKYKEGTMGLTLEYGKELSTGGSYGEQKLIMPNEEIDLVRDAQHSDSVQKWLAEKSGVRDLSKALIGTTTVVFEDGMVWTGQKLRITNASTN
jgi:hypothetical protein